MENEKIVYETIKDWKYGAATGYYNPKTDEIHILQDTDTTLRTIVHERIHRARRKKITFNMALLFKQLNLGLFTLFMLSAASTIVFSQSLIVYPTLFASIYLTLYFSELYEESYTNKLTAKIMRGETQK